MEKIFELAQPLLNEPVTLLIFMTILVYAGVRDYQTKEIKNKLNIVFFSLAVVLMALSYVQDWTGVNLPELSLGWTNLMGLVLGFFFLFIPAFVKNQPMGGDIKISAVVGFWLGHQAMIVVLLFATLLNLLYWVGAFSIWKEFGSKTLMPMAPFIALGAMLFYGLAYFL